jgi:hypothetical protein
MKQIRLRFYQRINAVDAILDNTLLPILWCVALVAFLWVKFQ